ncbi:hypothetical protein BS17DRAFT_805341 [Gyrodon lividus]|nr:hypothetical protein BS17DRAFT_805341 [Gyrodon lividus]
MSINGLKEFQISSFVGITLALLYMYGISLCQQCYYYLAYPRDKLHQKCLVTFLWGVNTLQLYCLVQQQWRYFVAGHGDFSISEAFPWQDVFNGNVDTVNILGEALTRVLFSQFLCIEVMDKSVFMRTGSLGGANIFSVSDRNKLLTGGVVAMIFGVSVFSVFLPSAKSYWCSKVGPLLSPRMQNNIQRITSVTINMGVLTCGITLAVWVIGPVTTIVTPIMVMSQSYVNSLMAVLNAREPTRSQRSDVQASTIQVPTLPTIYENEHECQRP